MPARDDDSKTLAYADMAKILWPTARTKNTVATLLVERVGEAAGKIA